MCQTEGRPCLQELGGAATGRSSSNHSCVYQHAEPVEGTSREPGWSQREDATCAREVPDVRDGVQGEDTGVGGRGEGAHQEPDVAPA